MFRNFFPKPAVCEIIWKNAVQPDKPQMTIYYGACAVHAAYLRLERHTQNIQCLLLFHSNNGYANAPQCYVTRTLQIIKTYIVLDMTSWNQIAWGRCTDPTFIRAHVVISQESLLTFNTVWNLKSHNSFVAEKGLLNRKWMNIMWTDRQT
jgi:hypothetical protein